MADRARVYPFRVRGGETGCGKTTLRPRTGLPGLT